MPPPGGRTLLTSHPVCDMQRETSGEIFIILEALLYGLFPIIINYGSGVMPPILFAGLSIICAAIALCVYLTLTGQLNAVFNKEALPYILGVTICIIIIPSLLIYSGTTFTSGLNTVILLEAEVLFTFLICGIFFGEAITMQVVFGAILMVSGVIAVLYNGNLNINIGELLIIAGTFFYPFGNSMAKKAMHFVSPPVILFIRSLLGGLFLIGISFLWENHTVPVITIIKDYWLFIIINGILIMTVSKILWYEGIRRLELIKARALNSLAPVAGFVFAFLCLHENPSSFQIAGLLFTLSGLYTLTRKPKLKRQELL